MPTSGLEVVSREAGADGYWSRILLPAICAAALLLGPAPSARAQPRSLQAAPPAAVEAAGVTRLVVGDKLRVNVFERLADSEDRWANQQRPSRPDTSFYLHQGLSGEFVVRSDGRISVPLLGTFAAAGRDLGELGADITAAFERLIGRRGSASVDLAARQPIYVLGAVRTPGPYPYEAGLTPLHAIALAGGLRVQEIDRGAAVEAVRELGRSEISTRRLQITLAKAAVLRAEQLGEPPAVPAELAQLVGHAPAEALLAEAVAAREPLIRARQERDRAITAAIESAGKSLKATRDRLAPVRANVAQRRARLEGIQALYQNGNAHRVTLAQAQSELAEASDREAGIQTTMAEAERQLTTLELERTRMLGEIVAATEADLATLTREIDDLSGNLASGLRVGSLFRTVLDVPDGEMPLRFEVVRKSQGGAEVLLATPTMTLEPGDLVRLLDAPGPPPRTAAVPERAGPPARLTGLLGTAPLTPR
ncbi:hypothetical protein EAH89_27580 [Roseomonas nepalensis]|uniref:Polysaccharide export protein N-terminal domain-containing protein n=1 Tax=Muricoccus nepalensis TaxID=1854500 RepID=A0A502F2L5_9PROT|nr:polysaccharide biosynthesis/export family protein [Roseomonas nepalensis]TPG44263.1 hypothetical protein EAH89_27580 [Roseomonas nepalensis]